MNIAVRYFTKGGNTAKVAAAIAKSVGVEAQSVDTPINKPVDILFLGGSIYAFGLDESIKAYIESLDANRVKTAAVFSTSAIVKSGNLQMEKLLEGKGIKVLHPMFYCCGEFKFMHKGHPNADDLKEASAFAQNILQKGMK